MRTNCTETDPVKHGERVIDLRLRTVGKPDADMALLLATPVSTGPKAPN